MSRELERIEFKQLCEKPLVCKWYTIYIYIYYIVLINRINPVGDFQQNCQVLGNELTIHLFQIHLPFFHPKRLPYKKWTPSLAPRSKLRLNDLPVSDVHKITTCITLLATEAMIHLTDGKLEKKMKKHF